MSFSYVLAMSAPPADGAQGGGNMMMTVGMMALIFLIFWFMIIRPQQKQQKVRQLMIASLKNGDKIITNGGLIATVKDVHEDKVVVFISDGVKVEIAKNAVGSVIARKD